jgi:hypothetical protein
VIAVALVAAAFVTAVASPSWLILLAPILLGTPHVAADLRYLVIRGPLARVAVLAPLAAMIGLRTCGALGGPVDGRVEIALGMAAIAAVASSRLRVAILAIAIPAVIWPRAAMLVLLHGHNIVALVIWLGFTTALRRVRLWIVGFIVLGAIAIGLGLFDTNSSFASILAPGLGPVAAGRVVVLYAFLQAIHYVIWLHVIPQHAPGSLRADFGAWLPVIVVASIAVPVFAIFGSAMHVRTTYLGLVTFHAWLELAAIAYLVSTRRRL